MPKIFVVSSPRWSRFRFCTVEALCRDALFHSTPHTSLRSSCERCTVERVLTPGGDAKSPWTARSIPQSPLSSRISPCASPASLLLHRKILFAQNLGIVPTTDSFTHPLPMLHKPAKVLFPPHAPPKSLSWFGTHGLRPCKTATKCRTPYAAQFVQRLSLLLRRTTAQTAQLLAVTPLASNNQGY